MQMYVPTKTRPQMWRAALFVAAENCELACGQTDEGRSHLRSCHTVEGMDGAHPLPRGQTSE